MTPDEKMDGIPTWPSEEGKQEASETLEFVDQQLQELPERLAEFERIPEGFK